MASASNNAMSFSTSGSNAPAVTSTAHQMMEVDSSRPLLTPKREEEAQLVSASDFSAQTYHVSAAVANVKVAFVDKELIPPTSRLSRAPLSHKVPSSPHHFSSTTTRVAISAPTQFNTTQYTSQDVHSSVNSTTSSPSSSAPRTFGQPSPQLETAVSSFSQPLHHHGLTHHPIRRPRTSPRVFQSSTDLAAHYGIPQILPPAPRTTSSRYLQAPSAPKPQSSPLADFQTLSQNYLNMLSKKPTDTSTTTATDNTAPLMSSTVSELDAPAIPSDDLTQSQLQDIADVLGKPRTAPSEDVSVTHRPDGSASASYHTAASPEFQDLDSFMTSPIPGLEHDFGSSPMETPFSDFLTTPLFNDDDMLTSPSWANEPLFPPYEDYSNPEESIVEPKVPSTTSLFDDDNLYTISPGTPALDTFDPSSLTHNIDNSAPHSTRRSKATGIRKGVTPDQLLDEEAPTQPRKYTTPSATSRKELPAVFARKRSRSAAFGADEEDQLGDDLPPNPTEKDLIEAKRRQNTVAARRSRRRKLEQFQRMEASRNEERQLKEQWQERANVLLKLVRTMGVNYPDFPPDQPRYEDA